MSNLTPPTPYEDGYHPLEDAAREAAADLPGQINTIQSWCPACGGSGMVMELGPTDCPHIDLHMLLARLSGQGHGVTIPPNRILADPRGGCACTPHWQDAGGGYTEFVPEMEPDCPVHSDYLYDPRAGAWITRQTVGAQ